MKEIKDGAPGDLPPVPERVPNDAWENMIRAYGVVAACEWFGHAPDSEFTAETIKTLREIGDSRVMVGISTWGAQP